jgi:hypothetical protein
MIHARTRTIELFRLMYESESIEFEKRTDEQQAAHLEWDRRLAACEAEHGSCYDRARRYEAYCAGRDDERAKENAS